MAYDEGLAARVRDALGERTEFAEIKMFGGICFTVRGNMALGVAKDDLMVRVGADAHNAALARPGARPMDFTKRPMAGYVFVDAKGYRTGRDIAGWVERALAFNATLPAKAATRRPTRKANARR